ncbi:MAG TPA: PEP/pyruvate-binding domain-containing protein [Verrucomicrobiales bacterium]|nr:PEP/pyruvate-binding domain-containing protein [Verrucomicrobiales bacterium]
MPLLSDVAGRDIGGKARTLVELQLAGFCVPEFLCSPADAARAIEVLGAPLAVRSSASAEDGSEVSFAGQFKSFLNLQTTAEVERAMQECRQSLDAPAAVEYCRKHGIHPGSLRMEVIVQRMIQPELAGVVFTLNPATGAESVVIEACEGHSDELLAGRKPALPSGHPALEKYGAEIERTARAIQRCFGAPQDIEFAIEQGRLYILQSRPITRIQFPPGAGEWTNADFRDGGVSCTVCTPLMWSLYDFIWEHALKGFLREIKLLNGDFQAGRMFFGRPYWNLGAVKQCLAVLPGFIEREFDRDLDVRLHYDGDGQCTPVTLSGILRALPALLAIGGVFKRQARFDRGFLDGAFEQLAQPFETVSADAASALGRLIGDVYRITELNYFRTIYCASLAKLDFMKAFPDADFPALAAALPPIRHLDPTRMLQEMTHAGASEIARIQQRFAHKSRRELDLRAPRWDEDSEWVAALIDTHAEGAGVDPRPAYESARSTHRRRLPWHRRRTFDRKLDRVRRFLWLREEMRDLSSRVYHLIRRHVLAIAEQRGLGDDIFFMTFEEILADDRSNIPSGRERYEGYRNFQAPNEIGARFTTTPEPLPGALRGLAASRGRLRSTAFVAKDIEQALRVGKGQILVCPYTDPGWTPVLARVGGVVAETGGMLSHAAVICREFGLPAVLGVAGATARIPDGSHVLLSGDEGFVEVEGRGDLRGGASAGEYS